MTVLGQAKNLFLTALALCSSRDVVGWLLLKCNCCVVYESKVKVTETRLTWAELGEAGAADDFHSAVR